jgi:ABC-type branched-subunit amino acid transport system substrate-binding protein
MRQRLQLFAFALWVALVASSALFAGKVSATNQTPAPERKAVQAVAAERGLTAQERRGKAIYLRGESPAGREITAMVGELDVPASTVTCVGCHGVRAEGKTEGGVTAGNLTWTNLIKPYGHTHPSGRKHGAFDESLFVRAISQGIDPAGNQLAVAMPRYTMSAADAADIVAYLKRIETDRDPGLSETTIKVGTILPLKGALAESGAAMRDVLTAYFDDLNGRGGIYNRKIELKVAETGVEATATAASARRLIEDGQVFAFVGGLSAGADKELAALTQESEIPFIGPSTLLPQTGFQTNRYIFYLLPGMGEQARALVNFGAGRQSLAAARTLIVAPENEIAATAAAAIEEQCKKAGCGDVQKTTYPRAGYDAASLVGKLKGADVVFFLGSNGEDVSFLKAAAASGWTPTVFLLGTLAARDLPASMPAGFKDKVFLAYPSVPADITPAGLAEFRALMEKYKVPLRHTAAQLSALAAAKILVDGLQRAGRDLSREKLINALEGLYDYDTGVTPRLTFGPNRRVGAAGAYILGVDPEKKQLVPVSNWIKAS